MTTITCTKSELRGKLLREFLGEDDGHPEVQQVIDNIVLEAERHRGEYHTYSDYLDVKIVALVG